MATQRTTFGTALGLTFVGLVIMLYGVSLNSGAAPNATVAVGGSLIMAAVVLLAAGVIALDSRAA